MTHRRDALADLRQKVFDRADQDASQTATAVSVVDALINDSVDKVALDAPYLFHDKLVRFATQPDVVPLSDADTVTLVSNTDDPGNIANPWVFRVDLAAGSGGGGVTRAIWEYDRSWDGRMVDIIESDGTIHTFRIQQIWREDLDEETTYVYFTIDRPFPWWNYGVGPFTWRVYTPRYYLPDDVIELKSVRIVGSTYPTPIQVISQSEAEETGVVDDQYSLSAGVPRFMYRRDHFEMPSPNTAPDVYINGSGVGESVTLPWKGPEPAGKFDYVFTLAWGKRDWDHASSGIGNWDDENLRYYQQDTLHGTNMEAWARNRQREPLWESSPSPVSNEIISANGAEGNATSGAVELTFPNIEYMLGFMLTGTTTVSATAFDRIHSSHSGWSIRIYRRRKTADFDYYSNLGGTVGGQKITGLNKLDIQDAFYLLAEFEIEAETTVKFVDDGSIIPDYRRRLRNIHGYQGVQFYPRPDARYEVEARVLQRPERLVSDSDAPSVHPEAADMIVAYTLYLYFMRDREMGSAQAAMAEYMSALSTAAKRYGDLRPKTDAIQRHPARARGYTRVGYRWWKRSS